jgi:hypothetical protein
MIDMPSIASFDENKPVRHQPPGSFFPQTEMPNAGKLTLSIPGMVLLCHLGCSNLTGTVD